MRVVYTEMGEKTLLESFTRNPILPRKTERVFIDDGIYEVYQVYHYFYLGKDGPPSEWKEVSLFKLP